MQSSLQKQTNQALLETTGQEKIHIITKENSRDYLPVKNAIFQIPQTLRPQTIEAKSMLNKTIFKNKNGTGFKFCLGSFNSLVISSNSSVKKGLLNSKIRKNIFAENLNFSQENQQKNSLEHQITAEKPTVFIQPKTRSIKTTQTVTRLLGTFQLKNSQNSLKKQLLSEMR